MKKRLILATVAVVAIACTVLGTLAMLPPRPGVTKVNFDRIEEGMKLEEVELILGKDSWTSVDGLSESGSFRVQTWYGADKACARFAFQDECVSSKTWIDSTETASEKLCRWVHWPWW